MKTRYTIDYPMLPTGMITIPKGTPVVAATNLPEDGYWWAQQWDNMSDTAESWQRNYGFLLNDNEVV